MQNYPKTQFIFMSTFPLPPQNMFISLIYMFLFMYPETVIENNLNVLVFTTKLTSLI